MLQNAVSYRLTILSCYVGYFASAIIVNLTPILFIPLRQQFGLSYRQLGMLVFINFVTQVLCDFGFSGIVDKYGFRPFILVANIVKLIGFLVFAAAPVLFSNPYTGFIIGTIIFSAAGGLFELLLSPIINAIPTEEKAAAMSVLHSFYAWGQLSVVLLTTLFLFVFGTRSWQFIILIWLAVPIVNFIMFLRAPLAPLVPEEKRQGLKSIIFKPFFIVVTLAIIFGGAAEQVAAQWVSAFMEKGMNIPKIVGDTAGVCSFAFMLGIGRLLYGIYGQRIKVHKVMIIGSALAVCCYVIIALSRINIVSFGACVICGISVSLLWPGALVIASEKYPFAGTWLFAILSGGGDIGCSIGPWITGIIIDGSQKFKPLADIAGNNSLSLEELGLRCGMLTAAVFPLLALICLYWLAKVLSCTKGRRSGDNETGDQVNITSSGADPAVFARD